MFLATDSIGSHLDSVVNACSKNGGFPCVILLGVFFLGLAGRFFLLKPDFDLKNTCLQIKRRSFWPRRIFITIGLISFLNLASGFVAQPIQWRQTSLVGFRSNTVDLNNATIEFENNKMNYFIGGPILNNESPNNATASDMTRGTTEQSTVSPAGIGTNGTSKHSTISPAGICNDDTSEQSKSPAGIGIYGTMKQ